MTAGEGLGNGTNLPTRGWDYTTGYGVPNVAALAADLAGGTAAVRPVRRGKESTTLSAVACRPFATSPAGDLSPSALGDKHQAIDVTSAAMRRSDDGSSLVITVSGPVLAPQVPPGSLGTVVRILWLYRGHTYLARSETNVLGATSWTVEVVDRKAEPVPVPAVYSPGRLVLTVPLSAVGSPPSGARLRYPVVVSSAEPGAQDVAGPDHDVELTTCH